MMVHESHSSLRTGVPALSLRCNHLFHTEEQTNCTLHTLLISLADAKSHLLRFVAVQTLASKQKVLGFFCFFTERRTLNVAHWVS